ncbi:MAG TPA: phosphatidylglycerol lysyltransferase domain-containing protein, partial [Nitrospiria bacterium]
SSAQCLACETCCRFPEKNSPLAPYFTTEEIHSAVEAGIPADRFPNTSGGRVGLSPHPAGEGYICPAFDPSKNGCRIYESRPLDCILYPFALMRGPENTGVLLGYDRKCPVIADDIFGEGIYEAAREMIQRLNREDIRSVIQAHPGLVGDYQPDVMVLGTVETPGPGFSPEGAGLTRLEAADRPLFESALEKSERENLLSAYSWPSFWIWRGHLSFYWKIIGGRFCLFAKSPDGYFMPILPTGGPFSKPVIRECFDLMDSLNPNHAVSRIENIGEGRTSDFENMGFAVTPVEQEYIYARKEIESLAGDRYKSQRWAENRFRRDQEKAVGRFEPFRRDDLDECLALYKKWSEQKEPVDSRAEARLMLEDSLAAHEQALGNSDDLGLTLRVVRINGRIAGYTAGFPFRKDIFCVLLEVADRNIQGLSVFLFREFCREMKRFSRIHAMGDSGLGSLQKAKLSYHPDKILKTFLAVK